MAKLSFKLDFESHELRELEVPIQIRRPDAALVKQHLSSDPVDLDPGTYYVSAKLPAGQELIQKVVMGSKDKTTVLAPAVEDKTQHESEERSHFLEGTAAGFAPYGLEDVSYLEGFDDVPPESSWDASSPVLVRVFAGNALDLDIRQVHTTELEVRPLPDTRRVELRIPGRSQLTYVQLDVGKELAVNTAVAAGPHTAADAFVERRQGQWNVGMHVEHSVANVLLRYMCEGELESASVTMTSSTLDAEKLLAQKQADPIAAAVGSYALLRFGELKRLHDWTKNLWDWFPWLPDGCSIYGEHLARTGNHVEAAKVLCGITKRGLPIFSEGFFYALDRLELYASLRGKQAKGINVTAARKAYEALVVFRGAIDSRRPVCTFASRPTAGVKEVSAKKDLELTDRFV